MPSPRLLAISLVLLSLPLATSASALELTEQSSPRFAPSIGARIGGYGFRQLNDQGRTDWMACRMDGIGFYGTLEMPALRHLFAELSADMYYATSNPRLEGLDRLSAHVLGVGGVRLFPGWLITPNIHAGGGVEYTWVELFGQKDQRAAPIGLLGIGAEINVRQLSFGLSIRGHLMQLPNYDWQPEENTSLDKIDYETEMAGQALFSMRYRL